MSDPKKAHIHTQPRKLQKAPSSFIYLQLFPLSDGHKQPCSFFSLVLRVFTEETSSTTTTRILVVFLELFYLVACLLQRPVVSSGATSRWKIALARNVPSIFLCTSCVGQSQRRSCVSSAIHRCVHALASILVCSCLCC